MEMEMEVGNPKHPTIKPQHDEEVNLKAKKRPRVDCSSNGPLERAEALQSRLDPKFPSFVKLMQKSHVSGGFWLGLPCFFCREHMPVEDKTIFLINDKLETFEVMYLARKDGFSGGWRRFSIAQGLIDGDVLVFHLIMPTTFKVFILRSSSSSSAAVVGSKPKKTRRKPSPAAHQRLATKASSCKPASSAKPEHSSKSDNDNHGELSESEDHDQRMKQNVGLDIDQNCASQMISEERMRKIKTGYRGCLEDRVYASENVVQAATKKAEALQAVLDPEFPSFVKSMSQSHVTRGFWLGLPSKFCKEHLPDEDCEITLIDENLDPFRTKYLVRSTALSGGWKGFSIFHKLVHGDALVFHLINPTTFKAYIIRASSSSNIHRNIDITYEENGVKPNNKRSGKNINVQHPKQEVHQQMKAEDAEECASDSGNVQPIATVSNRDNKNQCVADDIHEECATDNVNGKQEQEKKIVVVLSATAYSASY